MRGTTCPRCGRVVRVLPGDRLAEHKTDNYVVGQVRFKERCVYSDGTIQDAIDRITPLARKMLDLGYTKQSGEWVK